MSRVGVGSEATPSRGIQSMMKRQSHSRQGEKKSWDDEGPAASGINQEKEEEACRVAVRGRTAVGEGRAPRDGAHRLGRFRPHPHNPLALEQARGRCACGLVGRRRRKREWRRGGGLRWRGQQQAEEAAEKKSRLAAGALCLGYREADGAAQRSGSIRFGSIRRLGLGQAADEVASSCVGGKPCCTVQYDAGGGARMIADKGSERLLVVLVGG